MFKLMGFIFSLVLISNFSLAQYADFQASQQSIREQWRAQKARIQRDHQSGLISDFEFQRRMHEADLAFERSMSQGQHDFEASMFNKQLSYEAAKAAERKAQGLPPMTAERAWRYGQCKSGKDVPQSWCNLDQW